MCMSSFEVMIGMHPDTLLALMFRLAARTEYRDFALKMVTNWPSRLGLTFAIPGNHSNFVISSEKWTDLMTRMFYTQGTTKLTLCSFTSKYIFDTFKILDDALHKHAPDASLVKDYGAHKQQIANLVHFARAVNQVAFFKHTLTKTALLFQRHQGRFCRLAARVYETPLEPSSADKAFFARASVCDRFNRHKHSCPSSCWYIFCAGCCGRTSESTACPGQPSPDLRRSELLSTVGRLGARLHATLGDHPSGHRDNYHCIATFEGLTRNGITQQRQGVMACWVASNKRAIRFSVPYTWMQHQIVGTCRIETLTIHGVAISKGDYFVPHPIPRLNHDQIPGTDRLLKCKIPTAHKTAIRKMAPRVVPRVCKNAELQLVLSMIEGCPELKTRLAELFATIRMLCEDLEVNIHDVYDAVHYILGCRVSQARFVDTRTPVELWHAIVRQKVQPFLATSASSTRPGSSSCTCSSSRACSGARTGYPLQHPLRLQGQRRAPTMWL